MSTQNVNPETGIRYGIIAANSLDPEVIGEIQSSGRDIRYEEAEEELRAQIKAVCKDWMGDSESDDVADLATENLANNWQDDEPVHEFEIYGVKGRTTWLGGALLVWVFESKHSGLHRLCSPCVPNCGNLDTPEDSEGYICYDVPPDWRVK